MATTTVYRHVSSEQYSTFSVAYSARRDYNWPTWVTNFVSSGTIYNQGADDLRFININGQHEDYTYGNYIFMNSLSQLRQAPASIFTVHYTSVTTTI